MVLPGDMDAVMGLQHILGRIPSLDGSGAVLGVGRWRPGATRSASCLWMLLFQDVRRPIDAAWFVPGMPLPARRGGVPWA